jgi:ELWxxDGT repeat protein
MRRHRSLVLVALLLTLVACGGGDGDDVLEARRDLYFFPADDGEHGIEPWVSDGTAEGTRLLKDIRAGAEGSLPSQFFPVGGDVYFVVNAPAAEIWKTDGTAEGTVRVTELSVAPVRPANESGIPIFIGAAGGKLYFTFYETTHGRELWRTDGTSGGTRLLVDLTPGPNSSAIAGGAKAAAIGNRLVFSVERDSSYALFSTDGTEAGTYEAFRFADSLQIAPLPRWLLLSGPHDVLRTDGTRDGTVLVTSFNRSRNVYPEPIAVIGDYALLAVFGDATAAMWKSDGTVAGTTLLKDFSTEAVPHNATSQGMRGFFSLTRRAGNASFVEELWKTDGTEAGTVRVAMLPDGQPLGFIGASDRLFFQELEGFNTPLEFGLWSSDGTEAGTRRLERFVRLERPRAIGSRLMFLGRTVGSGNDYGLWKSDGTREGTVRIRAFR